MSVPAVAFTAANSAALPCTVKLGRALHRLNKKKYPPIHDEQQVIQSDVWNPLMLPPVSLLMESVNT